MGALLDHVRGYYEALNGGDADAVAAFFTDDAVHYYTRMEPHVGGRAIAENAAWAVENIDGQWQLAGGIDDGEQAVIEWSMTWRDDKGRRRLDRGTEWFRFRDGLICEVRAYFHGDAKNRSGDLIGFDHEGRGHTVLYDPTKLPDDLPVPEDDGAADHLTGMSMPSIALPRHDGGSLDLAEAATDLLVLFAYPRTGVPGEDSLVPDWDSIPGARGCTPHSCGFRDLHGELTATGARVVGLSAQTSTYQREFAERTSLPYPLLSDPELVLSAEPLRLPTFEVAGQTLFTRIALVARGGVIEKVFYPVFPPDKNAAEVLAWLRQS